MISRRRIIAVSSGLAFLATACGGGHDMADMNGDDTTRNITVEMVDLAFRPSSLSVRPRETVKFSFVNEGKVAHDAFVGDAAAQATHEHDMRAGGGMDHGDMTNAITVQPGKTGTLTYTFSKAGQILIGCHQPGHYAAGMKVAVTIG